jgi:putative toxin-antitoxin system antitoxin component (TIGR02293 family)
MSSSATNAVEALIQAGPLKLLGGPRVLVTAGSSRSGAIARSTQALPLTFRVKYAAVENLGRFLVESPQRLMRVIQINERTAQRRRERGALSPEESDRIARIARVSQRAIDSLGDENRAREWLKRPNRALQDAAPLDLLSTDAGSELVTDELGRIEYGDLY